MTRNLVLIAAFAAIPFFAGAQHEPGEMSRELPSFTRLVASPRINVILTEGEQESVRIVYHRIDPDKINVRVKGKTLQLYLDDSKVTEKLTRVDAHEKRSIYADVSVTAFVTYRSLRHIQIRGDQELTSTTPLTSEKLTVRAYGRNEINLASVKSGYFRARLYGENRLKVNGGKVEFQKYKLYGDNKIDTEALKSFYASATIFGESSLKLTTQDELRVSAFGESRVTYNGAPRVNRGLIFGSTEIRKID
jgi:hypothetical protein